MSSRPFAFVAATKRFGFLRFLPACALLLVSAQTHAAVPNVVVSVLPVHSLVSALMRGVGDARLLVRAGQSPHGNQLKPSQIRSLDAADLIVWVGPLLERPLEKAIAARRQSGRVVTLLENDQITLLPGRRGGVWAQHEHEHEHEHAAGHFDGLQPDRQHDEQPDWQADPHLWLSVANAQAIVRIVARELASLDPANRARYQANARDLSSRLEQLRHSLHERLRAVADSRYVVFHDAYQYFEQEFGLHPVGSLTVSPDRPPGARRIREIRQTIRSRNVRCVFSEPQFAPALIDTIVADTAAATGVLDPLGAALEAGADVWFDLMRGLADSLVDCLGQSR